MYYLSSVQFGGFLLPSHRILLHQGPRSKFSTGGGGLNANGKREPTRGDRGACSPIPENVDFNSSKMTGNAFKNNKRNV